MALILIIDDDNNFCETMESLIQRMGHHSLKAFTLKQGMEILGSRDIDILLLDVRLPDGNGIESLPQIRERSISNPEIFIITGLGDPDGAETAILEGVWDYIVKPTSVKQTRLSLTRALKYREEKFVVVDCAVLTESLLESTLFGHKKGSFTGAVEGKTGLVKLADGGTLFLDEVGEMPLSTQKSFLRVLQEKRFRPLGETLEITSDFRLIAATNRDLEVMVERGEFRQDLLYRLSAIQLRIPRLKERGGDIRQLSIFHINKLCDEYHIPCKGFEQGFFDTLNGHDWPGNVRELFNVLETAFVASGREETLYAMHLPRDIRIKVAKASIRRGTDQINEQEGFTPSFKEYKNLMEVEYLKKIISDARGDVQMILKLSGLSKSHFYSLLKKYKIQV